MSSPSSGSPEELKQQLLISQFVVAAGCSAEQAEQLLQAAHWHYEAALSAFFQESSVAPGHPRHQAMCTPANTPATPPNFPDTLALFSHLKASESIAGVPAASPPPPCRPGGFPSAWPTGQPNPWTPAGGPEPRSWPGSVSQQAVPEARASATMEAER
uniref:UBA like domain containing 1 n=1 Tax=Salvator merianae TaxID=96440 RepID=A0A8D0B8Z3_SALMN